jgi:energy-coupling factor transporter ATP-binding protein EcfA2
MTVKINHPTYEATVNTVFKDASILREPRLVMAISGIPGSGKTFTALTLARVLAGEGKIAVIDTENRSSLLYRTQFTFDFVGLNDHRPSNYVSLIEAAKKAKYAVLIVDGISPAWTGVLEIAGGDIRGWKVATPEHNKLIQAITSCRSSETHIICTMRSKIEHQITTNPVTNKLEVVKLGLKPIQREDTEYEFDLLLEMTKEHAAIVAKSRYNTIPVGLEIQKPDREFANLLISALQAVSTPEENLRPF